MGGEYRSCCRGVQLSHIGMGLQTKRQNEISKIHASLEKQIHELEKIAERLHTIAGIRFQSRHKPDGKLSGSPLLDVT